MSIYQNILVAVDLSEDAQEIAYKAVKMAEENKANIVFVYVSEFVYQMSSAYDPLFYPAYEELAVDEEALLKSANEKMKDLIKNLQIKEGLSCTQEVLTGIPKTEIIRLAEEKKSDLIVCGSHGRHGLELLLGSTANAILHHAACDVLAIRSQKQVG